MPTPELPTEVTVNDRQMARMSQRFLDLLGKVQPEPLSVVVDPDKGQPMRVAAFKELVGRFPEADPAELWEHAYSVEVEMVEADNDPLEKGL